MGVRLWVAGLVLVFGVAPANAEPLEPGRAYAGGARLDFDAVGLSVTVPAGWTAMLPPGSAMLVMTPDDQSYVLTTAEYATLDEARAFLSNPLPLGNGVVLQPTAAPAADGPDLVVAYTVAGAGAPHEGAGRVRALPNGIVVGVFSLAPAGVLAPATAVAAQFLASIEATGAPVDSAAADSAPQTAAAAGSGDDDDWHSYLMGRHLVRYSGNSSYNETQHIYLCANGHFRKTFGSGGFTSYGAGSSSGATASADSGAWHATGNGNDGSLILEFGDGSRSDIYLEYRDNKVYLEGVQWLRDPENSYCG